MANNDIVPGFDDAKDDALRIRLEPVPQASGCLILHLSGSIETYNSNVFAERVGKALEAGFNRLVFNCGELGHISSTGIGCFVDFLKAAKSHDGNIVLVKIPANVLKVFQLLGFSQLFKMEEDLQTAVAALGGEVGADPGEAETKPVFPAILACPSCSKKYKIGKAGRFRCAACKATLKVDEAGNVAAE